MHNRIKFVSLVSFKTALFKNYSLKNTFSKIINPIALIYPPLGPLEEQK